jgi:hypothetical protein
MGELVMMRLIQILMLGTGFLTLAVCESAASQEAGSTVAPACVDSVMSRIVAARVAAKVSLLDVSECRELVPGRKRTLYGQAVAFEDSTVVVRRAGDTLRLDCACITRMQDLEVLAAKKKSSRTAWSWFYFGAAAVYGVLVLSIDTHDIGDESLIHASQALGFIGLGVGGILKRALPSEEERELSALLDSSSDRQHQ